MSPGEASSPIISPAMDLSSRVSVEVSRSAEASQAKPVVVKQIQTVHFPPHIPSPKEISDVLLKSIGIRHLGSPPQVLAATEMLEAKHMRQ